VEIAHYLTSRNGLACQDVLAFWRQQEVLGLFPSLCQLAKLHLSSSATSVPVECMFSTTGLIMNSKRSSLSAEKLHRVSFVHDNFDVSGICNM
jgi:hypothetical protein